MTKLAGSVLLSENYISNSDLWVIVDTLVLLPSVDLHSFYTFFSWWILNKAANPVSYWTGTWRKLQTGNGKKSFLPKIYSTPFTHLFVGLQSTSWWIPNKAADPVSCWIGMWRKDWKVQTGNRNKFESDVNILRGKIIVCIAFCCWWCYWTHYLIWFCHNFVVVDGGDNHRWESFVSGFRVSFL